MKRLSAVLILATLTAAGPTFAETITVDVNDTGDFTAIAPAVDAASVGDTVLVLPGDYEGAENSTIDFGGKDVVLMSRGGCDSTTINGYMFDDVLLLRNGESRAAVVQDLTITMSTGLPLCFDGSSPTIRGCRFTENWTNSGEPLSAQTIAVGIAAGGSPLFEDCVFDNNTANARISTVYFSDSDVTLRGCTFTQNRENGNYVYGGPTGVVAFSGDSQALVENCLFSDNRSETCCLSVHDDASVSLIGCTFEGNTAVAGMSEKGLVDFTNSGSVWISDCTFAKNTNPGSCVSLSGSATAEIDDCTFVGNSGEAGQVINAAEGFGGTASVSRSILAFNESCAVPIACETTLPTLSACCFYETGDPEAMCEPPGPEALLLADPLFCGFFEDDYSLCLNSPCLEPNNDWNVQIGAHGWGCDACDTAIKQSSWGRIKSLFLSRPARRRASPAKKS